MACRRFWPRPTQDSGGTVFGYRVADPERYGVVDFDAKARARRSSRSPKCRRRTYAVTGLYFLDGDAPERARDCQTVGARGA